MHGEEFEELGFNRDLSVAGVGLDAVEEVGLLVVVRSEDNVVDDALEGLFQVSKNSLGGTIVLTA